MSKDYTYEGSTGPDPNSYGILGSGSGCGSEVQVKRALTTAQFTDKLRGMLLMGAYGDALGAPHEKSTLAFQGPPSIPQVLRGNAGVQGSTATSWQLQPFSTYHPLSPHPFGMWIEHPSNQTAAFNTMVGLPTDDTAFRIALLHDWLSELSRMPTIPEPTEAEFRKYLQRQVAVAVPPGNTWRKFRKQQIEDWLVIFKDLDSLSSDNKTITVKDGNRGNTFFRPGFPVIFGPFMYLELAAIYACCSEKKVFETFRNFTGLDRGTGKIVSGLMAVMISQAVLVSPANKKRFDKWFEETAKRVFELNLGPKADREVVENAFGDALTFGSTRRVLGDDEDAFLAQLRAGVFNTAPPPLAPPEGVNLRNFHPVLFLRMMAAVVGYSRGDVRQALRLLAVSPGDTDTMTTLLGSIIGAYCGNTALGGMGGAQFSLDLAFMQFNILLVSGIDLFRFPAGLIKIADRLPELEGLKDCCQKRSDQQ